MGLFSSIKRQPISEEIAKINDDVATLITTIDKLTDVIAKLSLLIQEQHAAIADLYVIQSHTLREIAELSAEKTDYSVTPTSTNKKSSKLN